MFYVYILPSVVQSDQTYIGFTSNLKERLAEHNEGKSAHTNKFKPWRLVSYVALPERKHAERLERYLKRSSGRAFARRLFRHIGAAKRFLASELQLERERLLAAFYEWASVFFPRARCEAVRVLDEVRRGRNNRQDAQALRPNRARASGRSLPSPPVPLSSIHC